MKLSLVLTTMLLLQEDPRETELRIHHPRAMVHCTYPKLDRFPPKLQPLLRSHRDEAFSRTKGWLDDYLRLLEDEGPAARGWDYREAWSVSARTDRLASLTGTATYYNGGVHPNRFSLTRTVWFDGDDVRVVRLGDLFTPCVAWEQELSIRVLRHLREAESSAVLEGAVLRLNERDLQPWGLTPKGIEFLFEPYRYGCYAEGEFIALVPYEEIRALLNPVGPAAEFLR